METRSRTTKLIVKNVEMLESQKKKFDKFDKVVQWLEKVDTFECHQHQKHTSSSETSSNVQINRVDKQKEDFFDSSDSSVNTGMHWDEIFFLPRWHFWFSSSSYFYVLSFNHPTTPIARYILTNRKNKRKSQTQCHSKIKKYRDNDVQFEYDLDDLDNSGHKLKRLKIDSTLNNKFCSVNVQKMNANEINFNGT